jgi:uncharacterized surface protein with fasciclin (FAS1) repeats
LTRFDASAPGPPAYASPNAAGGEVPPAHTHTNSTADDPRQEPMQLSIFVALAALNAPAFAGGEACASSTAQKDIVTTAVEAGQFKTLAAALGAAQLVDALKGEGPFTVFAPTDAAFAKLPAGTVENLLKPENRDKLKSILTYHVVPGRVTASEVVKMNSAKTVQGSHVRIATSGGKVMVDGATVVKTDIGASNGVIHVIDRVIMPK